MDVTALRERYATEGFNNLAARLDGLRKRAWAARGRVRYEQERYRVVTRATFEHCVSELEDIERGRVECARERLELIAQAIPERWWPEGVSPLVIGSKRYTADDIQGWSERSMRMGVPATGARTLTLAVALDLINIRKLPNDVLRSLVERVGVTCDLTSRVYENLVRLEDGTENFGSKHLLNGSGRAAETRVVSRWLGIEAYHDSGQGSISIWITYERAVAIAQALGVSFASVGV